MKILAASGLMIFLGFVQLYGFQWPSDPDYVVRFFCEFQESGVSKGIRFDKPDTIKPFDSGKVVYRYLPDPFSPLPGGGPSVLVLEHENGFQSVYEGLESDQVKRIPDEVSKNSFISTLPNQEGYLFKIRDARLQRLVNPLMLLPGLDDRRPPEMAAMHLVGEDGAVYNLSQTTEIPAGSYKVYVFVRDQVRAASSRMLMPYSVSIYNLGSLLAEKKLDAILHENAILSLQDGTPVKNMYNQEGFLNLGEMVLNSGDASLEIRMEDFFGNKQTDNFSFTVMR
jgi:hypothetical protein